MVAKLLDGKLLSTEIKENLKQSIKKQASLKIRQPGLAVILVGNDPASTIYVKNKVQACQNVGFYSKVYELPSNTSQDKLETLINELNNDLKIDGILVQLPLPEQLNTSRIVELIAPSKDVDGFHPYNLGRLVQRKPTLRPCTPAGIIALLNKYQLNVQGLDATVIGVSNIVGRPMILELLLQGATVTACHRFTKNLQPKVEQADLLIIAAGQPKLVPGEWIKPGAIVIDVGMNRLDNGKLVGDVVFNTAVQKASWITPVPGGVGPMTIAMLLQNTYQAYCQNEMLVKA